MAKYYTFVPFSPSNYDFLQTVNNEDFYVKQLVQGSQEFSLYKNSAENNRVDKSLFLELVGTISGTYREDISLTNLAITIEYPKVPDFNYIYITEFNRYYFVTDITVVRYNLYEISLSIDILMSYKNGIKKLPAFIERNENDFNDDLIDNKRVVSQGFDVEVITRTNEVFDTPPKYVLNAFGCKTYVEE